MKKLKVLFGTAIAAVMIAGLVTLSIPQEAGACPPPDCGGGNSPTYEILCEGFLPQCYQGFLDYWRPNCNANLPC